MKTTAIGARIALVFLCCLFAGSLQAQVFLQEFTEPGDFSGGICDKTQISPEIGGVVLSRSLNCVPFLWVPSAKDGIVSKIDARSGKELARYAMGPQNSRWAPLCVTVDVDGNAYVACSSNVGAKLVKICAANANTRILSDPERTSFDVNANGSPQALTWGSDSRVSVVASLAKRDTRPTALAFDANGLLWVSLWGEQSVEAVDIDKGAVVHSVPVAGRPDAMIAGSRGSLWALCGDSDRLCRIDTMLGKSNGEYNFQGHGIKSVCLGQEEDTIWVGSNDGLLCLNIDTGQYTLNQTLTGAALAGVTLDKAGDIWAACPSTSQTVRFSSFDLKTTAVIDVGRGPNSISVDWDGYVWTLDESGSTASRIDPRESRCVAKATTGKAPYSSCAFTAHSLKAGVCPSGSWQVLIDAKRPGAGWGTLAWDCTSSGGHIAAAVRSADVPAALQDQQFLPINNGVEFEVPDGRFLEVRVTFKGGSNTTPILRRMVVSGRNLPPDVSQATATNPRLLKLDHSMETVGITGFTDPEGHPVTILVTGVTQDEPIHGTCAGDKYPDATGIGTSEVKLRAERDPGTEDKPGNGRVYVVSFKATDILGANSIGKVKVTVPPLLSWDSVALEDAKKYDSAKCPTQLIASTQ